MNPARILIVEDEGIVVENVRKKLLTLGYTVAAAVSSGEEGVAQAAALQPDLVLMDISLAGHMDGITAAAQINSQLDIPVIYLTANTDEGTMQQAKITEPFGYLLKPFNGRELHSAIEMALYKHKMEQTLRQRNRELALLNQASQAFNSSLDLDQVLAAILEEMRSLLKVLVCSVWLVETATGDLVCWHTTGPQSDVVRGWRLKLDTGIAHWTIKNSQSVIVPDVQADPRHSADVQQKTGLALRSLVSVPLRVKEQVIGVLQAAATKLDRFTASDLALLESLAAAAAGAIENARLFNQAQQEIAERQQAEIEREKLQAQLLQSQKMEAVGRLAAGIAHDFNNLLTSINGFAELLQHRFTLDAPQQKYVEHIRHSGARAVELVRQLLAFSRKQVIEPQVVNLNNIVTRTEAMLQHIIGEDIELKTDFAPDLGLVEVDPGQIEQVIVNLAVNARDAMPNGGQLTLTTANVTLNEAGSDLGLDTLRGECARLTVADTGCGMDAETQAHLFEPFFTTKEQGKGTGLGLATVYGIVKQSGGAIRVATQTGRGTAFTIYLPRALKAAAASTPAEGEPRLPAGHETILLVEDDPDLRELAQQVLREQGYQVLAAPDAVAAVALAVNYTARIDLLLTDVIMPGADGQVLAGQLLTLRPALKVLFMSGYTDGVIAQHNVLEPGVDFLSKPFTSTTLTQKVRAVLDK